MPDPRREIGSVLRGRVLEIGPGNEPFPTAAGAFVEYADKPVEGGRDETWPELIDTPRGPSADLEIDLDTDGLRSIDDSTYDAAVACHVVEHLANPVAALVEMTRVLVPGGRLVLVVPDRRLTFDRVREPTPARHLLAEYESGTDRVDDDHIREFCEAIWRQESFHPEPVRSWHDPVALDDERLELHRRRSIHVHCWSAEEFVSLLAALVASGILDVELLDLYLPEDVDGPCVEFGLALGLADVTDRLEAARCLVRDWCEQVLARPSRDPSRLVDLAVALERDEQDTEEPSVPPTVPASVLVAQLEQERRELEELRARSDAVVTATANGEAETEASNMARITRLVRSLSSPLRLQRRS